MKIRGKFRTVSKNFSFTQIKFTPNLFSETVRSTQKFGGGLFNSLLPSSIHKTADGYEKYEERDNISPDVGDTRGGTDGVVARNEPFACERIIDDAILEDSCTRIHYRARHFEGVRHREPEDVEFLGQFL